MVQGVPDGVIVTALASVEGTTACLTPAVMVVEMAPPHGRE